MGQGSPPRVNVFKGIKFNRDGQKRTSVADSCDGKKKKRQKSTESKEHVHVLGGKLCVWGGGPGLDRDMTRAPFPPHLGKDRDSGGGATGNLPMGHRCFF